MTGDRGVDPSMGRTQEWHLVLYTTSSADHSKPVPDNSRERKWWPEGCIIGNITPTDAFGCASSRWNESGEPNYLRAPLFHDFEIHRSPSKRGLRSLDRLGTSEDAFVPLDRYYGLFKAFKSTLTTTTKLSTLLRCLV